MIESLKFDPETHRYWVDGRAIPSVTQIIAPLYDFSAIPPGVLEAKRALGTAVHEACDLDDVGCLELESSSPEIEPYVHAWRKFLKSTNARVGASEQRLYHPRLGYAGTLDRLLHVDGKVWLVDLKTSVTPHRAWGVQLAGYQLLVDVPIHMRAAVILRDDETYALVPYPSPNDELCFRALLAVHQWRSAE